MLICPGCQRGRDWTAELARCAACGSSRLVRALGRTECRDCGVEDHVVDAVDIVVHLFHPEARNFYGLEKMWELEAEAVKAPRITRRKATKRPA